MSDTWDDIQKFKTRQSGLRERLQKRRKEREGIVLGINTDLTASESQTSSPVLRTTCVESKLAGDKNSDRNDLINEIESYLLSYLCDVTLDFPVQSKNILNTVCKNLNKNIDSCIIDNLLQKFSAQDLIRLNEEDSSNFEIISAEHDKLTSVLNASNLKLASTIIDGESRKRKRTSNEDGSNSKDSCVDNESNNSIHKEETVELQSLLSMPSIREKENKKVGEEILDLLSKPTAKERSLVEKFKSQGGGQVKEFCPHGTKVECIKVSGTDETCSKLHFKKILQGHTDESLGDCSFLNTCFHMDTCKYVHYEVEYSLSNKDRSNKQDMKVNNSKTMVALYPPQWIQCDLRYFDMTILGKFSVIMADPPWDIHMELPYGTMSDDEMRHLNIPSLQDDGLMFLWVTGRAMELGRECLQLWGYERCDELIWVKTNQLQRIIRTGRTGHWLNHGKEHCLVGIKGNQSQINRGLDCDVIVAEVRATSHKPDEIYGIIERAAPGTRKIELFGRPHNVQPNWITLGNQVDGVRLLDPDLVVAFKERYPDGDCIHKK